MAVTLKNFTQFVSQQAAAVQASCSQLVDFAVGSLELAIIEANTSVALWIQALVLILLGQTRLATSSGEYVDSYVGDFGIPRLGATYATGAITVSRANPGQVGTLPVGTTAITSDNSQVFAVYADPTNPYYSATAAPSGAYVLTIGTTSITVPVQATVAGSGGNVAAGAINGLQAAIVGVDSVTNAVAYTNGITQETDAQLKARFPAFINSLSKATLGAIEYAVASVQVGLSVFVRENVDVTGAVLRGHLVLYVDDGSGTPPQALLDQVYSAVDTVRACGVDFTVRPPTVNLVSVTMTIVVGPGRREVQPRPAGGHRGRCLRGWAGGRRHLLGHPDRPGGLRRPPLDHQRPRDLHQRRERGPRPGADRGREGFRHHGELT